MRRRNRVIRKKDTAFSCGFRKCRIIPAGLVLVSAVTAAMLMPGCGEDGKSGNIIDNRLTFQLEGGAELTVGKSWAICCGEWEPGYRPDHTLKIFFYDPLMSQGMWKLFIDLSVGEEGGEYDFPVSSSVMQMFIFDIDSGYEFSSGEPESSGTITINEIDCGPPLRLSFSINASIGSEYAGIAPMIVIGDFECTIESNESLFGCDFGI